MSQFWIKEADLEPVKGGKTIVITGGSSGMGLAVVKQLLELGNNVVSGDMNDSPVSHPKHTFLKTDVTSWAQQKTLFQTAWGKHGRIDHVFANAGISGRAEYLKDQYDEQGELQEPATLVYDINLRGMMNTGYLGMHYMRKQDPPGGSIVCTASGSSFQRFGVWDYTTAKHGVYGWMRGAIPNLREQNLPIRINCIGPSWTLTGLVPKEIMEKAGIETQTAEVVAELVAYLFADESRQGQFIYSAGGRHYEIEESKLLPLAWELCGGVDRSEEGAYERLKEIMTEIGQLGKENKTAAASS